MSSENRKNSIQTIIKNYYSISVIQPQKQVMRYSPKNSPNIQNGIWINNEKNNN